MSIWRPFDDIPLDLSEPRALEKEIPEYNPPQQPVVPHFPPHGAYGAPLVKVSPSSSGYNSVEGFPPESPIEVPNIRTIMDADLALSEDPDFLHFQQNALNMMAAKNGGVLVNNNPRMRRAVCVSAAAPADDAAYQRQRERNNLAAKRSRDRRKLREIQLGLQVAYLNKKVAALKAALNKKICVRCDQCVPEHKTL